MNPILIAKTNCQSSKKSSPRVLAMATGAALLIIAGTATSCRTTAGLGKDIEAGGEHIQRAAR